MGLKGHKSSALTQCSFIFRRNLKKTHIFLKTAGLQRTSVFDRLGAEAKADATTGGKVRGRGFSAAGAFSCRSQQLCQTPLRSSHEGPLPEDYFGVHSHSLTAEGLKEP